MIKSLLQKTSMPLLQQFARFNERRQAVLTENIARIDTPGYKTRDLPVEAFQQALRKAVDRMDSSSSPFPNSLSNSFAPLEIPSLAAHSADGVDQIESLFTDELFQSRQIPSEQLGIQDNGKRGIESEMMEMTRTLMQQSYAMQLMNAQFNLLQSVISERP